MAQRRSLRYLSAISGPKFSYDYVVALKRQVDVTILGYDRDLHYDRHSWWVIMEAFAPWNEDLRPCLWVDLDTYIFQPHAFDDLDRDKFWMIRDFNTPGRGECGVMLLPKDTSEIWNAFLKVKVSESSPPGGFIRQFKHDYLQDHVEGIYSYKRHCKDSLPEDAVVCCFHGQPKAPDTKGWAKQHWTSLISPKTSS